MNNGQDMSPDFVLMRLVSAAEDDHLDEENGNVSSAGSVVGFGASVLAHHHSSAIKNGFELNHAAGQPRPTSPNQPYRVQPGSGTCAPDDGVMVTRPSQPPPPPPPDSAMAQRFEFPHRAKGSRPQIMVFRNLLRAGDGGRECGLEQQGLPLSDAERQAAGSVFTASPGVNNNSHCSGDSPQQHLSQKPRWSLHPRVKLPRCPDTSSLHRGGPELCPRHRLATDPPDWPPSAGLLLDDKSTHHDILDPRWAATKGGTEPRLPGDPMFDLARKFGELGVDKASKMLFKEGELPHCPCQGILGPASVGIGPGEDPTETSDALLVLEGLGAEEVDGLDINSCSEEDFNDSSGRAFILNGKGDVVQKIASGFASSALTGLMRQAERAVGEGCCPGYRDPQVCCPLPGPPQSRAGPDDSDQFSDASTPIGVSPCGSTLDLPAPAQTHTQSPAPKLRVGRCASSPLALSVAGGDADKTLRVPGKSRKGSLKIRLSKLFRTKSCNGSNDPLDKRPSVDLAGSAGSLMDVSSGGEQDLGRKPRLTRTQSAFSPVSFSPVFTGETVSLVDVDISRRGVNSPHPPTPPPPPRRSLSLLDTFLRALPRSSPSQTDAPPTSVQAPPPLLCPLSRPDASSFAASLRELEKCGWYWGPMNWEDAEMKLKGKPDGSFLVRDSSDPRYILSLSFRSQSITHHTRMEHYRGTFSLWCHPKFEDRCHSVVEFIERAIMHSKNGKFLYFLRSRVPGLPPTPVQLLYPVSRFSNVKSLQHLCRFRIRQLVRIDHIQELPLPKPLITYLRKFYYYDPEEEMYLSLKEARSSLRAESEAESQT
ncbi:suppressor of cytokine signaling 7 isoform X2 [Amia ocellicauda]|uniref:suppressor of cytokine signaling 7 isoform X2 n=1 Tax=Amia ocellicauda TaxID=2972642 RepID=UPI003464CE57